MKIAIVNISEDTGERLEISNSFGVKVAVLGRGEVRTVDVENGKGLVFRAMDGGGGLGSHCGEPQVTVTEPVDKVEYTDDGD